MSLDLLNEFGTKRNASANLETKIFAPVEEDEDFGEFEEPEDRRPTVAFARPSKLPEHPASISDLETTVSPDPLRTQQFLAREQECDDQGTEDAWGAFETTSVLFDADQTIVQGNDPLNQSQSLSNEPQIKRSPKVKLLPIDQRNPVKRSANTSSAQHGDQCDYSRDEIWEPTNFSHTPINPVPAATLKKSAPTTELGRAQSFNTNDTTRGPPPSNVPPPSLLLPLIAQSFQSIPTNIKHVSTDQSTSPNSSGALAQQKLDEINRFVAIARAGAHVLAGRKLRWKRDNILSQSMKIGPAGGKASGMKLTGVDKTESRREDQEAAEVLGVWRKQLGSLRSAISMIKGQKSGVSLAFPDISENMPIRVIKPSEGAVSAPKACFLCGIRRDERVAKVDINVEDSFGEWWCEHWGHIDCVAFWEDHRDTLPQR